MRQPDERERGLDYNKVLEAFVDENDDALDLQGLVAYALYKRQKRDWIVKFRADHGGRSPNNEEIAAVTSTYLTKDVHEGLRKRASDILSDYADVYVEAVSPQIRENALANETVRQARDIERHIKANSGFRKQVGVGLVSTAIWTLLVTAIALAGLFFGSDLIDAWSTASPSTE